MVWSWVATTTVVPALLIRSSSSTISALFSGSRLPVGSSAMTIAGFLTTARAIATRCCSPPESWWGRRFPLSRRPTSSSASGTSCLISCRLRPSTCSTNATFWVTVCPRAAGSPGRPRRCRAAARAPCGRAACAGRGRRPTARPRKRSARGSSASAASTCPTRRRRRRTRTRRARSPGRPRRGRARAPWHTASSRLRSGSSWGRYLKVGDRVPSRRLHGRSPAGLPGLATPRRTYDGGSGQASARSCARFQRTPASMKSSMSPSSTASVLPTSCSVRRSLTIW